MIKDLNGLYERYPDLVIEIQGADVKITDGDEEDSPSIEFTLKKIMTLEEIFNDISLVEFVDGYFFGQQLEREGRRWEKK